MSRSELVEAEVGSALPKLSVDIDSVHIFMFSAVTWNRHLIHYDADQARHEGHQSIVAQRGLLGNYFVRAVTDWLDDRGDITHLDWKVVFSSVPGDRLVCAGEIVASDEGVVVIKFDMTNQDGIAVASGSATVRLT